MIIPSFKNFTCAFKSPGDLAEVQILIPNAWESAFITYSQAMLMLPVTDTTEMLNVNYFCDDPLQNTPVI